MSEDPEILHQTHLSDEGSRGFGHSGRGVRVRQLDDEKLDEIEEATAAILGPEASVHKLVNATIRAGICRMVAEVTVDRVVPRWRAAIKLPDGTITEPVTTDTFDQLVAAAREKEPKAELVAVERLTREALNAAKWHKCNMQELAAPGGIKKFFTAKDYKFLIFTYHRFHDAAPGEMNELLGKALPVASED